MDNIEAMKCRVCGSGDVKEVYRMDKYEILQCGLCKSGFVKIMPDQDELSHFYKGFNKSMSVDRVNKLLPIARCLFEQLGLWSGCKLRFLDVGGGVGLFSRAFEKYGYGESTYIDIDNEACQFASRELGITNVINRDIQYEELDLNMLFDLIYCRHVIEHLVDPFHVMKKLIALKATNGKVVIQCPNSDSIEYIAYYYSTLALRWKKILRSTEMNAVQLMVKFLGGGVLHGIDPPRHLWAFSEKGLRLWAENNGYGVEIFTTDIGNLPFSPFYAKRMKLSENIADSIGRHVLSKIYGGAHLVAIF